MPSSRGPSQPRDQTRVSCISCVAGGFLTAEPVRKPCRCSDKLEHDWGRVVRKVRQPFIGTVAHEERWGMFRLEKGGLQGIGLSLKSQMAMDEGDLFSLAQRAKLRSAQEITGHTSRLMKINYFLMEMFYWVGQKVHLGFSTTSYGIINHTIMIVTTITLLLF